MDKEWKLLEMDNTERDILQPNKYMFKYLMKKDVKTYRVVENIIEAMNYLHEGYKIYYKKLVYHKWYGEGELLDMLIRTLESHQDISSNEYVHYRKNSIQNSYHIQNILTDLQYQKENL